MFYSSAYQSVDAWRQDIESFDAGDPGTLALSAFKTARDHADSNPDNFQLIPTIAGFAAVYAVNTLAVSLVAVDGPLPFGDIIGFALWSIPDATIYGLAYDLFD